MQSSHRIETRFLCKCFCGSMNVFVVVVDVDVDGTVRSAAV